MLEKVLNFFSLKHKRVYRPRKCPHVHLQPIYGDHINLVGGYRLQCRDCWSFLLGPVGLSVVDRDPDKLLDCSHEDYSDY